MKKLIALSFLLVFVIAGCAPKTETPVDPLSDWLAAARLDAEETPEELYAAALKEDMLVIYSTTTRMMDVAASFEKRYPGLLAEVSYIREGELYDALAENYETGDFSCDLVVSSDGRGVMINEFLPKNIAVKYTPYDIKGKIIPGNDDALLMFSGEAPMLSYNKEHYPEPPVGNWWELTEEKWRGMVYLPNPARSATTLAFLTMIEKNSETMENAYEELYGKKLELSHGENAGLHYIKLLVENGVNIVNSSDEVMEAVGLPGSGSPFLGIMASSKVRSQDIGYEVKLNYDMEPFCGVYSTISAMIAGGAKNVNCAKLFIRWLLGETDGQGEGYKPYLLSGAWSVRSDIQNSDGDEIDGLNLWHMDRMYIYEKMDAVLSSWEELVKVNIDPQDVKI